MSTIKVTNLQNASAASPAIVLDANSRATLNGLSYPTEGSLSGRNRIINGDMRIDQRNAGASVTQIVGQIFPVDRFYITGSVTSKFTSQQNAGSITPPPGFTHYLGCTSSSAYSAAAGDYFLLSQHIEGFNAADLDFGKATAKTITLSFWVRSSLTGTFGGAINNYDNNRSYVFSYSISAANTWEYKTISIAGDTTGTWYTNNLQALSIRWSLGVGSTYSGTAGSWSSSQLFSATGATSVVGTNGATFFITGVQLEAGSVATPFERRSYGQELLLCQRYFEKSYDTSNAVGSTIANGITYFSAWSSNPKSTIYFRAEKRTAPTMTGYSYTTGASGKYRDVTSAVDRTVTLTDSTGTTAFSSNFSGTTSGNLVALHWTADAEL